MNVDTAISASAGHGPHRYRAANTKAGEIEIGSPSKRLIMIGRSSVMITRMAMVTRGAAFPAALSAANSAGSMARATSATPQPRIVLTTQVPRNTAGCGARDMPARIPDIGLSSQRVITPWRTVTVPYDLHNMSGISSRIQAHSPESPRQFR